MSKYHSFFFFLYVILSFILNNFYFEFHIQWHFLAYRWWKDFHSNIESTFNTKANAYLFYLIILHPVNEDIRAIFLKWTKESINAFFPPESCIWVIFQPQELFNSEETKTKLGQKGK